MNERSTADSDLYKSLVPIGRCIELLAELRLSGYTEEQLPEAEKVELFRDCQMEYCEHEQIVRNHLEGCHYFLIVNNSAEIRYKSSDTTTVHKRKLLTGGHFLNRVGQQKKLVLLSGCTAIKIQESVLLERAARLRREVQLYRLMMNSLPTNKMDGRYVRSLSKKCTQRRLSKGEWLMRDDIKGTELFFLLQGHCRMTHQSISVSTAQHSMVGEEILFQETYCLGAHVESTTLLAYSLDRSHVLQLLNPSTIGRLRKIYQERQKVRSKSLECQTQRLLKKKLEDDKAYDNYKSMEQVHRRNIRVDLSDQQLKETFSHWSHFKNEQIIQSRQKRPPSIKYQQEQKSFDLTVQATRPHFYYEMPLSNRTSRRSTNRKKFKRICCGSSLDNSRKVHSEESHSPIRIDTNHTERSITPASLSKTMRPDPISVFSYRFENAIPQAPGNASSQPTTQVDFMQDINTRIMKRVVIMSKKKVDFIYDNLEMERKKKERMVRSLKSRTKGPLNIHELYKLLVVAGKKH